MDGLLLVDKPAGPTSHDVVARMRMVLGERRIGHTGTLDPAATGLLPLVVGRATRLARFLSGADKSYEAAIRLGVSTCTGDAEGDPMAPPFCGTLPSRAEIERTLNEFRGTYTQQPPAFSAKRIGGRRSYDLARRSGSTAAGPPPVQPAAMTVTTHRLDLISYDGDTVAVLVDCSAGFYVRSLAADLGRRLGTGAHLTMLRRTRSGAFSVDQAMPLAGAERDPARAAASLIPMSCMLPEWSSVTLNPEGVRHAITGREIGPAEILHASATEHRRTGTPLVRLVDTTGELIGVGEPSVRPGLLHPAVVLR